MAAAALTAQQRQVILNSAQVFQDGVNAMNQVYGQVFAAGDQLKGQAMVSTARLAVRRRHQPMDRRLQQHQGNAAGNARPACLDDRPDDEHQLDELGDRSRARLQDGKLRIPRFNLRARRNHGVTLRN